MLFAYIGPEVMMPMASIITGIVGVFLMFGRNIGVFFRRAIRSVLPEPRRRPVPSESQGEATGVSQTSKESLPELPEGPSAV
jgi:hypothetical protein